MAEQQVQGTSCTDEETSGEESKHFGLLDLPPELWSKIRKEVVDGVTAAMRLSSGVLGKPAPQPDITRVCSLLRAELLPYFYCTGFALTLDPYRVSAARCFSYQAAILRPWLQAIGRCTRRTPGNTLLIAAFQPRTEGKLIQALRQQLAVDSEVSLVDNVTEHGVWAGAGPVRGRWVRSGECAYVLTFT